MSALERQLLNHLDEILRLTHLGLTERGMTAKTLDAKHSVHGAVEHLKGTLGIALQLGMHDDKGPQNFEPLSVRLLYEGGKWDDMTMLVPRAALNAEKFTSWFWGEAQSYTPKIVGFYVPNWFPRRHQKEDVLFARAWDGSWAKIYRRDARYGISPRVEALFGHWDREGPTGSNYAISVYGSAHLYSRYDIQRWLETAQKAEEQKEEVELLTKMVKEEVG